MRSGREQLAARNKRQCCTHGLARNRGVVVGLASNPPAIAESKVLAKPQVGVSRYSPFARYDVSDALRGHTDIFGQAVLRQAKRLQEFFMQHFAGRNRGASAHTQPLSVVIHDLNILRAFYSPDESHAPLTVHAHAVLPRQNQQW